MLVSLASGSASWRMYPVLTSLLILWIGYWYSETLFSMVAIWSRSATFTHGFAVFPISVWLIWQKRGQLRDQVPKPSPVFLLIVAAVGVVWLLGVLIEANVVMHWAFIGTIVAVVVALVGTKMARTVAFPLAFLFFAVPTGEFLLPVLMGATADFTVTALRLTGIPVHREGLQFVIPSGSWSVVEACSGIRYLIASLTVGSLFAYLNFSSWRRRAIFIGVSLLVPIIANWIRAYLIVLVGHLSNNRLAAGVDHLIYGWLFFGFVLFCTFMIGARWSESKIEPSVKPLPAALNVPFRSSRTFGWMVLATAGLITVPPSMVHAFETVTVADLPEFSDSIMPEQLGRGWLRVEDLGISWRPAATTPTELVHAAYRRDSAIVHIAVARQSRKFREQSYGLEMGVRAEADDLSNFRNSMSTRHVSCGVHSTAVNSIDVLIPSDKGVEKKSITTWQFFYVDGKLTASFFLEKLLRGLLHLKGDDSNSFSIFFYADKEDADKELSTFMRENCLSVLNRLRHSSVKSAGLMMLNIAAQRG